jgi:hypothetical protein
MKRRDESDQIIALEERLRDLFEEKELPSGNFRQKVMSNICREDLKMIKINGKSGFKGLLAACIIIIAAAGILIVPFGGRSLISRLGGNSSGSISSKGDYPYYADTKALVEAADVVASVEVLSVGREEIQGMAYTVSEVKVIEAVKGAKAGDVLKVKQPGDSSGKVMVEDAGKYLEKGRRYVLFLKTYGDVPASLLNPVQGMVELTGNMTINDVVK